MIPEPQNFRQRESFERRVACEVSQSLFPADTRLDLSTLGGRSPVAPEKCRPNYRAVAIEEHRGVHLAGNTHASDSAIRNACSDFSNGRDARAPPVIRVLLRPPGVRCRKRERTRCRRNDVAAWCNQQCLDATRADVEAKEQRVSHYRTPMSTSIVSWSSRSYANPFARIAVRSKVSSCSARALASL